ncbi:MAG TPA: isochorismatase family protein [Planctomycetota bacterium]|nr:isochorismatase family protein [Planctomycetota bacterium]
MNRALILILLAGCASAERPKDVLTLHERRGETTETATWKAAESAVIICDMWDTHTCAGAARRVADLAPHLNAFVQAARADGVLIVHAPSDVIKFYDGTPQRQRAKDAPLAKAPIPFQWNRLDPSHEGPLPIDDSDWCDCEKKCPIKEIEASRKWPWTRQIATIEIAPEDVISADGQEIYNVFRQRGIRNVILSGVHTNMCVLGRSFGIRQMVKLGMNVVLVRDLTDGLYDPRKPPHVSHAEGVALLVRHIETYWCPSISSADVLP